jgi:cytochrome c peroxidase
MKFQIGRVVLRAPSRQTCALAATATACMMLTGMTARRVPAHAADVAERRVAMRQYAPSYARPIAIPFPKDNPGTPEREALGRSLFFDPRLSGSDRISCASCHNPALSWGDGLPRAVGHTKKPLGRRTPTLLNLAWSDSMFWDGRAESLEEQALGPIQAAGEMNLSLDRMVAKIGAIPGYQTLFARGYPGEPISETTVAKAIATFERQIVSDTAPFDRWQAGADSAMSPEARRGFELFNTKAACATCHSGWRFTDDSFHDIGVPGADRGRGTILPDIAAMQHAFKTPTLRNVASRAPYMHDGSIASLEDVVELYDQGGLARRASLSAEIRRLRLTPDEKQDVIAFLRALTSMDAPVEIPALPR